MNKRLFWRLLWPVRMYIRYSPIGRGKGFLTRHLLRPLYPQEKKFRAHLPTGGTVELNHEETLGECFYLYGSFEKPELLYMSKAINQGSTVIDVGANIGLFTIVMAQATGPKGRVFAVEPLTSNIERLKANVVSNNLDNVSIIPFAAGAVDGETSLYLASDGAYGSTLEANDFSTGQVTRVPMARMDRIWNETGTPRIEAMKIDVEGGELAVLEGCKSLLQACRPLILIEANTAEHLDRLKNWLSKLGYVHSHPSGFRDWNHIFEVKL